MDVKSEGYNEPVAMGSLKKICATLNMDFADVVELYQKVANCLVGEYKTDSMMVS